MFGGVLAGGRPLEGLGLRLLTDEDDRRSPNPWFGIPPTDVLTLTTISTWFYNSFNGIQMKIQNMVNCQY